MVARVAVVHQRCRVGEALQGGVEEACVAHIDQACPDADHACPVHLDLLFWVEHHPGRWEGLSILVHLRATCHSL